MSSRSLRQLSKKTNFCCAGQLITDPIPKLTRRGFLVVEFFLRWQRTMYYHPIEIPFVCLDKQIGEYIVENFHMGDILTVLESIPVMRLKRRGMYLPFLKFLVFDVLPKDMDPYTWEPVKEEYSEQDIEEIF